MSEAIASKPDLLTRLNSRARWEATRLRDAWGDLGLGIDASWERAPGLAVQYQERCRYEGIPYAALRMIAQHLDFGADDTVIDIGCGKGRATCWFATLPIRKSIGLDFDPELTRQAKRNVETMRGRRADIEIRTGDAMTADYRGISAFFLYNPFGPDIMREVMGRIERDRTGSPIRIVYGHPLYADVLDAQSWLKRGETFAIPHLMHKIRATVWTSR